MNHHHVDPRIWVITTALSCIFTNSGCSDSYAVRNANFGDSVRYTIALQTADPNRDSPSLDGVKGEQAMVNYRTFEPIQRPEPVDLNTTGSNSGGGGNN
jgi:hypothetical protein